MNQHLIEARKVLELIPLVEYPDEMYVVVKSGNSGNEDWCYNIWNGERANCKQGEILAEENDKDFDEKTCVLLLDATN